MIASGYTLALYCDLESDDHEFNEFPHEFCNEKRSVCWRKARQAGWYISMIERTAICPKCAARIGGKKLKKLKT